MDFLHVDAEVLAAGLAGAGDAAVEADDRGDGHAVWKLGSLDHFGDDADAPEFAVATGKEEDALLVTHLDRKGRGNRGEDDCLFGWDQSIGHKQLHFL